MRHIFVINPQAGKRKQRKNLEAKIKEASAKTGIPVETYISKAAGDGGSFAASLCKKRRPSEALRFYACGGDGFLNEVANGLAGNMGVELGCVPLGTGNDYIRNYGEVDEFLDLEAQLKGSAVSADLIHITEAKEKPSKYCVNMVNIGFDCNVADQTNRTKKWPLIGGSFAYLLSIVFVLLKKKGADLRVEYEDGSLFDGPLLLIAIAKGFCCGGGIKALPRAQTGDGFMDVGLVKNVPRRVFLLLFPKYKKGTHLEKEGIEEIIDYKKCKKLTITPNQSPMLLCVDGEISSVAKVTFQVVPGAIRFAVPAKS